MLFLNRCPLILDFVAWLSVSHIAAKELEGPQLYHPVVSLDQKSGHSELAPLLRALSKVAGTVGLTVTVGPRCPLASCLSLAAPGCP